MKKIIEVLLFPFFLNCLDILYRITVKFKCLTYNLLHSNISYIFLNIFCVEIECMILLWYILDAEFIRLPRMYSQLRDFRLTKINEKWECSGGRDKIENLWLLPMDFKDNVYQRFFSYEWALRMYEDTFYKKVALSFFMSL